MKRNTIVNQPNTKHTSNSSHSKYRKANPHREPLYAQLVTILKNEILKGSYPVGTQLPPEGELSKRFDVSRHTVREALRRLRDDGLVSSRQGAGTTVISPRAEQSYIHEIASISDLITFVAALRFHPDSIAMVESDKTFVERIKGTELGQKWLKLEGFRYLAGTNSPVCWMEVFVHIDYAGVARLLDQNEGPIFELIEKLYGERVTEVEQVLKTSPMPEKAATELQTISDDTAVEVQRFYRVTSGKLIEISITHYPAKTFSFSMKLRRTKPTP